MTKKKLADELLEDVDGGKLVTLGEKWTYDIKCPVCQQDDMLHESLEMYSSTSGLKVMFCRRCEQGFSFDQNGTISLVETRRV